MEWNLADAKNRFSEVVNLALTEGPQRVRRRKDAVIIVAAAEFERLTGVRPSFKDFLAKGESLASLDKLRAELRHLEAKQDRHARTERKRQDKLMNRALHRYLDEKHH